MKKIIKLLFRPFSLLTNYILNKLNIFIIYRFGNAIGDQLCMTAIVENLSDINGQKVIVFSNYPEIFKNNPKIFKNYTLNGRSPLMKKLIISLLKIVQGTQIEEFCFPSTKNGGLEEYMKTSQAKISLIEAHSLHFTKKLYLKNAKPKIYFSDDELNILAQKFDELPKKFAIIQPIGKTTYTPNKEWGFEKYQTIIHNTKDKILWVQIGLDNDLLLKGVVDFRGKTKTLRELSYIIKNADFVLSNEGLLNHMAASVDTKSFVVFSGFHPIEIAKYETTTAIANTPQIDCAPCWLLENCPKEQKVCTEAITVEHVVHIIYQEMTK